MPLRLVQSCMKRLILVLLLALPLTAAEFSYVYSRGEGADSISRGSLDEVLRLKKQYRGTYLWARVDGKRYLIRDAAALAEAERAFAPMREHGARLDALHRKMDPIQKRAEALERRMDALTDIDDDEKLSPADKNRLREYKQQLRAVEAELQEYEEEERKLESREEELDHIVDTTIERIIRRSVRQGLATRLR